MTAPTPERRVGEEWVKEIAALPLMDGSVGLPRLGLPKSSAAFPHFCRVHNGQVALAGDLLDAAKEVARLTAEVERLREALTGACDVLDSAVPLTEGIRRDGKLVGEQWDGVTYTVALYPLRQQFRAALSLPTPAPEAQR